MLRWLIDSSLLILTEGDEGEWIRDFFFFKVPQYREPIFPSLLSLSLMVFISCFFPQVNILSLVTLSGTSP